MTDFILHILIVLNNLHDLFMFLRVLDHLIVTKMSFGMIRIGKNEVFGYFLELGA